MIRLPLVLLFTAVTFLSWGVYGVLLHFGQDAMDHSSLRPFVGVGLAYFLIAVLIPGALLSQKGEKGHWSLVGTLLSLLAGTVGALGALGIILALNFGGKPFYVMPFVFGLAPVVNTLVTATINRTFKQISFLFMVGLFLVICGAVGVLMSRDTGAPKASSTVAEVHETLAHADEPNLRNAALVDTSVVQTAAVNETVTEEKAANMMAILSSMIIAAFCWGAYGPVLHIGQGHMGGSRLRPFCCVGLAYFGIAVALPLIMLQAGFDTGNWNLSGMAWSITAGAAGAIGALGIIYAFNFGGKPIFVMPLVFGFAPIINTITSMGVAGTLGNIKPLFIGALATSIAGAVMVLVFQPRPKPKAKTAGDKPEVTPPPPKTPTKSVAPSTSTTDSTATPIVEAPPAPLDPPPTANIDTPKS